MERHLRMTTSVVVWWQQRVLIGLLIRIQQRPGAVVVLGVVTPTWLVVWLSEPAAPPTFTRSDLVNSADSAFTLEAMSVLPAGPLAPAICRKPV